MGDAKSLAHTKWNCKYHVVFAPKYRRQVFYGEKRRAVGEILRKLCEWKGVNLRQLECLEPCTNSLYVQNTLKPQSWQLEAVLSYRPPPTFYWRT